MVLEKLRCFQAKLALVTCADRLGRLDVCVRGVVAQTPARPGNRVVFVVFVSFSCNTCYLNRSGDFTQRVK